MNKTAFTLAPITMLVGLVGAAPAQQTPPPLPKQFESSASVAVPVVLCIDDKPTAGGQPSGSAYAKAAANGFRSVLTLRSKADGVDLVREQLMVEQNKMRYFNILTGAQLPARNQVDQFLTLAREQANHPMLINCAFAERVAPFMMIFRITDQHWSEDRAVEEANLSGLNRDRAKKFVKDYLTKHKK